MVAHIFLDKSTEWHYYFDGSPLLVVGDDLQFDLIEKKLIELIDID